MLYPFLETALGKALLGAPNGACADRDHAREGVIQVDVRITENGLEVRHRDLAKAVEVVLRTGVLGVHRRDELSVVASCIMTCQPLTSIRQV